MQLQDHLQDQLQDLKQDLHPLLQDHHHLEELDVLEDLVDQVSETETAPPVDPVLAAETAQLADLDLAAAMVLMDALDCLKINEVVGNSAASKARNLSPLPDDPVLLLPFLGQVLNVLPFLTNSRDPITINSDPADTGTSATRSDPKFANVRDCSDILQIVTNFTSVTGTNGLKNSQCTCSHALLS